MRRGFANHQRITTGMVATCCAFWAALPQRVLASDVRCMTTREVSDLAGQVIVGRISSMRSYWTGQPRAIETEILFESVEYLKGRKMASTGGFRLIVPGGTIGETQMRIADAPTFNVGEKWILFLLPTYKTFPVVGLNKGAFRVVADAAAIERVYLPGGKAVLEITGEGVQALDAATARSPGSRLVGADHIRVLADSPANPSWPAALRLDDFRAKLAPILKTSRDHELAEPAGKRLRASYAATPFRNRVGSAPRSRDQQRRAGRVPSAPEAMDAAARARPQAQPEASK